MAWTNSQSMALTSAANLRFQRDRGADRRGRPGRARGARAGPGQPRPGRARGPARPRRVGGRGRRGAAQGPPARRRRPRRAGLGQAHPDHPRRHRHHPARYAGPPRRPDHRRPAHARGGVGHPCAPRRHRRQDRQRDPAHRPRGRGHLAVARGRRGHRLGDRCSTASCSTSRRWSCRRPRPVPAPSCEYADGRELHPRTNLGLDARRATRELADRAWQTGRARLRRRRDRGPRPRRVRRPGARPLARRRRDVPPHPDRRRVRPRRGRQDRRVPLRRDRRAVHRRSPSSAPPAGSGRGSSSSAGPASRDAAPARRDQPADAEQVRPLGEHAAHHRRRVRGGRGRRGRRHRAALRQPARARPTRSAAGSPATPVALLIDESHVATVADPAGGAYAVEKLTDDLAVAAWELFGRLDEGADLDAEIADDRRRSATARWPPAAPADRAHRVPEPRRDAARARSPAREAEVRRYGAAFEALRDDPLAEPVFLATDGHGRRSTPRGRRSPPTCSPPAASPSTSPARPRPPTTWSRRTTASRSSAWPAPTRPTTGGRRGGRGAARGRAPRG